MQQVQREEFTGPSPALSRALAKAEAGKNTALRGGAMLAILIVVIVFFGLGEDPVKLTLPGLVLVYGLFNLGGGLMAARKHSGEVEQLKAAPTPPDVTWYALSDDGLTILTDTKVEIGDAGLVVPWAAMHTLTPVEGASPHLRLKYRLPKTPTPAIALLSTDRRRSDGTPFGDRMQAWFDARAAATPSAQEA